MMRTQFDDLFFSRLPYMRYVFFEEFGEPDDAFSGIFNIETSNRMREQTTGITGFGYAAIKAEGDEVTFDILKQEYDKTYTHSTYALAFAVTEEAFEDDLDGPMRSGARALGRSMRTTKNTTVWNEFNGAFGTVTSPDGKAVFASDHPLVEGGTFSNIVSADFGISTWETVLNRFHDFVDQRSLPLEISPEVILFPPEMEHLIREIFESEGRPDTADRATNIHQGRVRLHMSKWLTGDDDVFIGTNPGNHRLYLWNRRMMRLDSDTDFKTGNGMTKSSVRHSQGWSDWIGWVGVQGTS
jgi:phage major head subunit gpT-like protein